MATLDVERLRKVRGLMTGGATEGERAAARSRAEAIAKAAGMTLSDALSRLDTKPAQPRSIFDGFDDWMEAKEPGHKAREAAKRAERNARDARRRTEVLAVYGSEVALFARTEREARLAEAVDPIATWDHWTGADGTLHRYASSLDGITGEFWNVEGITPSIREAAMEAYPWPATLAEALAEVKDWDHLRRDRGLFCDDRGYVGEWSHYAEVQCRILLLEHELQAGRPAASWDDLQARLDWKRHEWERQWIEPKPRDDPFMDRLEADLATLKMNTEPAGSKASRAKASGQEGFPLSGTRRTNADKRADVLSMLGAHPELSDREIARRVGVSPQTVGTHRKAARR